MAPTMPASASVNAEATTRGVWIVALAALLFGCKGTFIKLAYAHGASVDVMMVLRMLASLPFFVAVGLRHWPRESHLLSPREWLLACATGICGYYVASYCDMVGLQYVTAGLERVILYTYPVFVILLSTLWLRQRVSAAFCLRALVVYTGLLLVFYGDIRLLDNRTLPQTVQGSLWVLASALVFSVYVVGGEFFMRRISSALFTAVSMTAAGLVMIAHFLLRHPPGELWQQAAPVYALSVLVAVLFTVVPSFMMAHGIRAIGSARASTVGMVGPLATVVIAALLLQEWPGPWQLGGMAVVLAGMYRLTRT